MPYRREILATGEIYHIFNRSNYKVPIFRNGKTIARFTEAMIYYLQPQPSLRFSIYRKNKNNYQINPQHFLVKIISYCLMPNHFHFLVRQEKDGGIQKYFQKLINSYSHYFNLKNQQKGHLFESPFKARRVETEEQLIHLSRYIHLNPVSDFLVRDPKDYPYSSYSWYLGGNPPSWFDHSLVTSHFPHKRGYEEFVLERRDYQRQLTKIKHLLIE